MKSNFVFLDSPELLGCTPAERDIPVLLGCIQGKREREKQDIPELLRCPPRDRERENQDQRRESKNTRKFVRKIILLVSFPRSH